MDPSERRTNQAMETTASSRWQRMDVEDPIVDFTDTPRNTADPFSLITLAYYACPPECRLSYDTRNFGVSVDLQDCCTYLMAPGNRLRASQAEGVDKFDVCSTAAFNGHIDCLRQAHVAGIPWDLRTIEMACRTGHIECLRYAHKNGCETGGIVSALAAAYAGQIRTLEYAWIHGFSFPPNMCTLVARFGSLVSLRYIRSLGFIWNVTTCTAAARYGQLQFLKYLHEHNCPWDETTCFAAAQNGNIECLEYAHTNGCQWDIRTCHIAAQNGHLSCLMYAHTNGCEWNIITTMMAAINNQPICFHYAVDNGCPWPPWLSWEQHYYLIGMEDFHFR